jgi:hypothetical protein
MKLVVSIVTRDLRLEQTLETEYGFGAVELAESGHIKSCSIHKISFSERNTVMINLMVLACDFQNYIIIRDSKSEYVPNAPTNIRVW